MYLFERNYYKISLLSTCSITAPAIISHFNFFSNFPLLSEYLKKSSNVVFFLLKVTYIFFRSYTLEIYISIQGFDVEDGHLN